MKIVIDLVKNIVLPEVEKDLKFDIQKLNADFWKNFSGDLLRFEADAKPLYASIYSLELADAEKMIGKLPGIYAKLIEELAESYVLEQPSEAVNYLLKARSDIFLKRVRFFKTMQQAIKSVERKRIKVELPKSYDRLTFQLTEDKIANAAKKKGREDLKEKMKKWDKELVEESSDLVEANHSAPKLNYNLDQCAIPKSKTKVISLSWMKYAVAASIIIAAGIFYFKNTDPGIVPFENRVVTTEERERFIEPQVDRPIDEIIALAEIETSSRTMNVLEPSSLGFTSSDKKTKLIVSFKDATQRIISLEKFLEKNKVSSTVDSEILDKYKVELADLNKRKGKYVFDGKTLTLFSKYDPKQYAILSTEDKQYFLKKGTFFYDFKISKNPMSLEKVTNVTALEALEKIEFENE